jgi:hypothetical protein
MPEPWRWTWSQSVECWFMWTAWYNWHHMILLECLDCGGVLCCHHFVGAVWSSVVFCNQRLQSISSWTEGNMILKNVRNHLPTDTASHPSRLESSILETLSHLWLRSANSVQQTDTCSYFSFLNIYFRNFVVCSLLGVLSCILRFYCVCCHGTAEVLKHVTTILSAV